MSGSDKAGGLLSVEMRAELDRLQRIWSQMEGIDFDVAPNDETRRIDQALHAVWNVGEMPAVMEARRFQIPAGPTLDASTSDAVAIYPAERVDDGLVLYIHGGGWAFGNLETHERLMRALANATRRCVVGVHYRLAPEHPFPAGLNDVISAYRAISADPERFGLSHGRLLLAGDSAGANLALAVMLHELTAGRRLPSGALLFYGVFGMDFETPSYRAYGDGPLLSAQMMRRFWRWYLSSSADRDNVYAIPGLASDAQLTGLPPLFLLAAEIDPLASDTINLANRLHGLGRADTLHEEPGVVHSFMEMAAVLPAARRAIAAAAAAADRFFNNGDAAAE